MRPLFLEFQKHEFFILCTNLGIPEKKKLKINLKLVKIIFEYFLIVKKNISVNANFGLQFVSRTLCETKENIEFSFMELSQNRYLWDRKQIVNKVIIVRMVKVIAAKSEPTRFLLRLLFPVRIGSYLVMPTARANRYDIKLHLVCFHLWLFFPLSYISTSRSCKKMVEIKRIVPKPTGRRE